MDGNNKQLDKKKGNKGYIFGDWLTNSGGWQNNNEVWLKDKKEKNMMQYVGIKPETCWLQTI